MVTIYVLLGVVILLLLAILFIIIKFFYKKKRSNKNYQELKEALMNDYTNP